MSTVLGPFVLTKESSGSSTRLKKWRCQIFSDVGGPTMVGSIVPGEILKKWPPRLAKSAFPRTNFFYCHWMITQLFLTWSVMNKNIFKLSYKIQLQFKIQCFKKSWANLPNWWNRSSYFDTNSCPTFSKSMSSVSAL